jgi:hypothetical protein
MLEATICLMAIADLRTYGYVDAPPSAVTPEILDELIQCGAAVGRSENLWIDGWRVYSPRAVRAGLFRVYVPRSIHTRVASPGVRVPSLDEIEDVTQAEFAPEDLSGMRQKTCMD